MTSSDDDFEGLHRLANERRKGTEPAKKTAGAKKPATGTDKPAAAQEDIASVLGGREMANTPTPTAFPGRTSVTPHSEPESLDQLLSSGATTPPRTSVKPKPTSVPIPEAEDLAALTNPYAATSVSTGSPVKPQAMPDAIRPEDLANQRQTKTSAAVVPVPRLSRPKLAKLGMLILALVVVSLLVFQFLPPKTAVSSPIASQVSELAAAVDAYYKQNGVLPKKLTDLPEFPEGAIQWPVENYGLRSMDNSPEFFFGDESGYTYYIIGRQGEEAWAFAKGQQPELQQVPAH
ncbi:MAG: hypothetical protein RLZZ537_1217 [Pseudomonadota bacterium]